MKILLISPLCPLPLERGGAVRIWNIACELSKHHTVDLVCFIRKDEELLYEEELKKVFRNVKFIQRHKMISARSLLMRGSRKWLFFRHNLLVILKSLFSLRPLLSVLYDSRLMKELLLTADRTQEYDCYFAETYYAIASIRDELCTLKTPIVLIEQNIEYLLYKRQVEIQKNIVLRIGMMWDVWKMKREEILFWKRVRYLGGLSLLDNAEIRSVTERQDVLLLENGVNVAWFSEKLGLTRKKNRVLFVGSFSYFTNVDALIWLLEDICPKFMKNHKSTKIELHIVGRGADASLKELVRKKGLKIDESVEDIRVAFQEATVLFAPLRAGSGTKYKILEAMASHCPVLTTDIGAEGLEVSNGKHLIVENEGVRLAEKLNELIEDEKIREQLTVQGYNFVKEYYDWPKVVGRFERQLNQD